MVKDYYQILGVLRDADESQIKKSYRKLAQEWHPDTKHSLEEEKQKEAEEKFKEISEAYAVLSDPEKKINYDATGNPNQRQMPFGFRTYGDPADILARHFGFRQQPPARPQAAKGQSVQRPLDVSLKSALFGGESTVSYDVTSGCEDCGARGGTEFEMCPDCKGSGARILRESNMVMQTTCPRCRGQGQRITKVCEKCSGQGVVSEEKTINVKIPKGIRHGMSLRIPGRGGRGFNGGPPGDILLVINLQYPDISQLDGEEKSQLEKLLTK